MADEEVDLLVRAVRQLHERVRQRLFRRLLGARLLAVGVLQEDAGGLGGDAERLRPRRVLLVVDELVVEVVAAIVFEAPE